MSNKDNSPNAYGQLAEFFNEGNTALGIDNQMYVVVVQNGQNKWIKESQMLAPFQSDENPPRAPKIVKTAPPPLKITSAPKSVTAKPTAMKSTAVQRPKSVAKTTKAGVKQGGITLQDFEGKPTSVTFIIQKQTTPNGKEIYKRIFPTNYEIYYTLTDYLGRQWIVFKNFVSGEKLWVACSSTYMGLNINCEGIRNIKKIPAKEPTFDRTATIPPLLDIADPDTAIEKVDREKVYITFFELFSDLFLIKKGLQADPKYQKIQFGTFQNAMAVVATDQERENITENARIHTQLFNLLDKLQLLNLHDKITNAWNAHLRELWNYIYVRRQNIARELDTLTKPAEISAYLTKIGLRLRSDNVLAVSVRDAIALLKQVVSVKAQFEENIWKPAFTRRQLQTQPHQEVRIHVVADIAGLIGIHETARVFPFLEADIMREHVKSHGGLSYTDFEIDAASPSIFSIDQKFLILYYYLRYMGVVGNISEDSAEAKHIKSVMVNLLLIMGLFRRDTVNPAYIQVPDNEYMSAKFKGRPKKMERNAVPLKLLFAIAGGFLEYEKFMPDMQPPPKRTIIYDTKGNIISEEDEGETKNE